ncbi:hypothetical protein [Mycoplasmopsis columboralis]|uniref:DNA processing protein n=1 Tax=Mycoplasmopsis columboralis TaxID=171282 RepID=A0A449B7G3_9BACT|nr:hypothetical protein [Mycoplasmopsis columboralis]VEU76528.1 DNA processing protein [Mycoplasmopsis columboralis]
MNWLLQYLAHKYKNNVSLIFQNINHFDEKIENEIKQVKLLYQKYNVNFTNCYSNIFPIALNYQEFAFLGFWSIGNIKILDNPHRLYLVAEDNLNEFTKDNINKLTTQNTIVINGYKSEHKLLQYLIEKQASIILIHKQGLDKIPANLIAPNVLHISLYPLFEHTRKKHFKESNYLSAVLSEKIIIFSTTLETKINALIEAFASLNKQAYSFPSDNDNSFNNELIKQGVQLITFIGECQYV